MEAKYEIEGLEGEIDALKDTIKELEQNGQTETERQGS